MKKAIIFYLAGAFTVLVLVAVFDVVSKRQASHVFDYWTDSKDERVISEIGTDAGHVAILKNSGKRAKENQNMMVSRWNEQRIVLTPNEDKQVYVDIELRDGKWSKIQVFDLRDHKQVSVKLEEDNRFLNAQVFGEEHMLIDKNFDGLVDLYAEHPPRFGNKGTSKVFYVTDSGIIENVFGESLVEADTNRKYRFRWDGSAWKKEYKE